MSYQSDNAVPLEIAFINGNLADLSDLIASLRPGIEVVVLDPAADGLAQIAQALDGRSGLAAIHLIGHGSTGVLQLGDAELDAAYLQAHAGVLADIGGSLSAGGDILVYGCDTGAGAAGGEFVRVLAEATGADVAASDDPTGGSAAGGDWTLEVTAGQVETAAAVGAAGAGYGATLALSAGSVYTYSQNTWAFSSLAQGADGSLYMAHKVDWTSIAIEKWTGSGWAQLTTLTTAMTGDTTFTDDLSLQVSADGNLDLLFRHAKNVTDSIDSERGIKFGTYDLGNGTWTTRVVDQASDPHGWKNADDPVLATGPDGTLHAAYAYTDSNDFNGVNDHAYSIKYATSSDGGASWTTSTIVTSITNGYDEVLTPIVKVDSAGKVYLFYMREDGDRSDIYNYGNLYLTTKAAGSNTWTAAQKVVEGIDRNDSTPVAITTDGQGHFYVGYVNYTTDIDNNITGSAVHMASNASGQWRTDTNIVTENRIDTVTDIQYANGKPYLLIASTALDYGASEVFVARKSGDAWVTGYRGADLPALATSPSAISIDESHLVVRADGSIMVVDETGNATDSLRNINYTTGSEHDFGLFDAPKVDGLDGDSTAFTPGATDLAADLAYIDAYDGLTNLPVGVTDADSPDLMGGNITIVQTGGAADGHFELDAAGIVLAGPDSAHLGGMLAAGSKLYVFTSAWVEIGQVDATLDGQDGRGLLIHFTSTDASPLVAENIIKYMLYGAPGAGARAFVLTVADGDGQVSQPAGFGMQGVDIVAPTVSAITAPGGDGLHKVGDVIQIQVSFSEAVTVTGIPQLVLETGAIDHAATYLAGSGSNTLTFGYTVQAGDLSSDLDVAGSGALLLGGGRIADAAGNDAALALPLAGAPGSLSGNQAIALDGLAPVDIALSNARLTTLDGANAAVGTLSATDATPNDSFTWTLVSGSGDADNAAFAIAGSTLRALDAASLSAGTHSVRVRSTDAAGNAFEKSLTLTVAAPPTVVVDSDKTSLKAGETATVKFSFSDAPSGFTLDDVNVAGGTLSALAADPNDATVYYATFTPAAAQSLHASIAVGAGSFSAGGLSNVAASAVFAIGGDTLAPSVTLAASQTSFKAGDSAVVTFSFSEAPLGFGLDDVAVSGGTLSGLAADPLDPTVYRATFTPAAGVQDLAAAVSVGAATFADAHGNLNAAAATGLVLSGDTRSPAVSDASLAVGGASGANGSFRIGDTVTVSWNDGAAGDDNGDTAAVTVDFSQFGGPSAVAATLANGVWSASYGVGAGSLDAGGLHAAITVTDRIGNTTTHAGSIGAALDNQAPVLSGAALSVTGATGTGGVFRIGDTVTATWDGAQGGNADVAGVSFDFSQFGGGSVAASAAGGVWSASYTVAEAPLAGSAHVAVSVVDDAGNAATAASAALALDAIRPHVASIALAGTPAADASAVDFTLTFDEAIGGLDAADLALVATGGAAGNIVSVSGAGTTYTVRVDGISGDGSLQLRLNGAGTGIQDGAGNLLQGGYANGAVHTTLFAPPDAAPVIGSNGGGDSAAFGVAEKQRVVTTVGATDADGDTIAYSISGGADAALFEIDGASGQLRFKNAPLAAAPADSDHDNRYEVQVTAADGRGGSDVQALSVTVLADLDGDGRPDISDDDIDNDGRPNSVEDPVPGAFGVTGDGNGDGVPDSAQINVASLPTVAQNTPFATLAVAPGLVLSAVSSLPTPSGLPRGAKMPAGQLDFTIGGVAPGGTAEVSIYVDATLNANGYYKKNAAGVWVNLATSVSTVGSKTKVTFALTDGSFYDSDHTVNGSISDPGGVVTITPLIGSNGGEQLADLRIVEGTQAVTTVTADAVAAVTYSIAGGADAALFRIDPASGALRFADAPSWAAPRDAGLDNTYEVQVQASDAYGSDVQTLRVQVTAAPPALQTVDGVSVSTALHTNGDGTVSTVITIPVVESTRVESVGGNDVADVALASAADGTALLSAQVPTGVGLQASGTPAAVGAADALTNLIREIRGVTVACSHDQTAMTGGGSGFLDSLPANANLLVQTIVPTVAAGVTGTAPLVIQGVAAGTGAPLAALVIDAQQLPAGSEIQLQDVAFAALLGSVRVTGGAGAQTVWADGHDQYIVLGADDDILHGGAGDDTVGSEGGNDRIYGDEGNDLVFGGSGNDYIDGGSGTDTVQLVGSGRADYAVRMDAAGNLVFTHRDGGADGVDTIANVEVLRFLNGHADGSAQGSLVRLSEALLGRAPDAVALNGWTAQLNGGATLAQVADHMLAGAAAPQGTDADFVTGLYHSVLGRTVDAAGLAYWTDALAHGTLSRGALALALTDSAERLAQPEVQQVEVGATDVGTLVRMYDTIFGRAPDVAGINYWIALSEGGTSLAAIADDFVQSQEALAQFGTMDDGRFVETLYRTAMHREGAQAEVAGWTTLLASGALDRGDVLLAFTESAEKVGLVGVIGTTIAPVDLIG